MSKRVIIAGGGTGGHIFPAIAIARALKKKEDGIRILFVGAKGKMEMQKIPEAGFEIEGLDISGFNRSSLIKNISLPAQLVKSFLQVRRIFKNFQPDAVIGVGGYSSFPVLRYAQWKGIDSFIHESNSFAGKSNRILGRKATKIFTGTEGMERFFPREKIMVTGNPVRQQIAANMVSRNEGLNFFGLDPSKQTLLVLGGSQGALSVNEAIDHGLDDLIHSGLQVIWQTGKPYAQKGMDRAKPLKNVWVNEFISEMEYAYAAADIVVSRSGAMTVAELCVVKKPVLFVPYPFAAEDHQTVNAMQLVQRNAAWLVKDRDAGAQLVPRAIELAKDILKQKELIQNISAMAVANADTCIAEEVIRLIKEKKN